MAAKTIHTLCCKVHPQDRSPEYYMNGSLGHIHTVGKRLCRHHRMSNGDRDEDRKKRRIPLDASAIAIWLSIDQEVQLSKVGFCPQNASNGSQSDFWWHHEEVYYLRRGYAFSSAVCMYVCMYVCSPPNF